MVKRIGETRAATGNCRQAGTPAGFDIDLPGEPGPIEPGADADAPGVDDDPREASRARSSDGANFPLSMKCGKLARNRPTG